MPGTCWAAGEIDLATAPAFSAELRRTIDGTDEQIVTVDCAAVTFMGTAGYRVLAAATEYAAMRSHTLVIRSLSHACARMIRLCDSYGELRGEACAPVGSMAPAHLNIMA